MQELTLSRVTDTQNTTDYKPGSFSEEIITVIKELVAILVEERRKSWHNLVENMDMTHNSQKP